MVHPWFLEDKVVANGERGWSGGGGGMVVPLVSMTSPLVTTLSFGYGVVEGWISRTKWKKSGGSK